MSNNLRITIKNAYKIEGFNESFFNNDKPSYIIYASNRVGKKSFANIIKNYSTNSLSEKIKLVKKY